LRRIVKPAIAAATKPSPTQHQSHPLPVSVAAAKGAAKSAVTPIAIMPAPGTAVNEPARSIASRMTRTLSNA
jgi:hypothetical protein